MTTSPECLEAQFEAGFELEGEAERRAWRRASGERCKLISLFEFD